MEWLPTLNVETLIVALPPLSVPVPIVVVPSLNVTVPVAVLPALFVTVAVRLTDCPKTDGLGVDVTVVTVFALLTVCVMAADVLPLKLLSPL